MSGIDRPRVFATAERVIGTDGPDAVTLSRVARELGVTQPALYHHVDGMDDLWRGLGLIERQELARRLGDACLGKAGPDAVRAVSAAWRTYGLERPGMYQVGDRYPVAGDPELEAQVERVVDILTACVSGFGMSDEQAVHAARTLRSALHGFVSFELGDGHPKPHEPEDTFTHIVELLIVGFTALANGEIST